LWQSSNTHSHSCSQKASKHNRSIRRRAIGSLAHHNGTSAYSPSLTCNLPAPTIECLHRPPYKLTCSSHNFRYELNLPTKRSPQPNIHVCTRVNSNTHCLYPSKFENNHPVTMETPVHCCERNNAACPHCYPPMTPRPSSIVALLRKRNNVVLVHCCSSANVTEPREPHTCNSALPRASPVSKCACYMYESCMVLTVNSDYFLKQD
jgi:hypothetical protein